MKSYPIENQVCTPEQAKKLAELLGDDAPESLWYWKYGNYGGMHEEWCVNDRRTYPFSVKGKHHHDCETYRAYTGDELGALFKNAAKWNEYPCYSTAQEKAALAIEGLRDGWIKKEEFRY